MTKEIEELKSIISNSDNIVFFGGAGVSTESGIPDFRSVDGIYNMKYDYPPEEILSHSFYKKHPEEFYRFYRDRILIRGMKPNKAHKILADLESQGKLKAIITQNIDGLHQLAGSKNVIELHGSTLRNYCDKCGKTYSIDYMYNTQDIPKCECGGTIRPDVVLYEESLNNDSIEKAIKYIQKADVLIIAGTSLIVYPAAGFINYYTGNKLVIINRDITPKDNIANLVIHGNIGETLDSCHLI